MSNQPRSPDPAGASGVSEPAQPSPSTSPSGRRSRSSAANDAPDVDVAVIGGGIVGLATAHLLLEADPALEVVVLEAEDDVGRQQSSRNSGVLHAGLYYPPGSAKARWSRAGKPLLERFCADHGVSYRRTGKVVVAVDREELTALHALAERAETNGVEIHRLGPSGLRDHEPHVSGVAGLWTPETGVTDFGAVCHALADAIREQGGHIHTGTEVVDLHATDQQVDLTAAGKGHLCSARTSVVCAGLRSDRLVTATTGASSAPALSAAGARRLESSGSAGAGRPRTAHPTPDLAGTALDPAVDPAALDARIVPVRGSWLELRPDQRQLVRGNIYPVPTGGGLPFLGVHLTRRIDGQVWVGPNAVPVFARQGRRPSSIDLHDLRQLLGFPGTWRLARQHWKLLASELWADRVLTSTVRAVQRYVPAVQREHLRRGPWGVRAQLVDRRGRLVDDFTLREHGRTIHVLNAPSPAATSALAIGAQLRDRALAQLRR